MVKNNSLPSPIGVRVPPDCAHLRTAIQTEHTKEPFCFQVDKNQHSKVNRRCLDGLLDLNRCGNRRCNRLEFTENACVNELALQSKSVPQAADATMPNYKNAAVDISDEAIGLMAQFVAALPAPTRAMPTDAQHAQ